MNRKTRDYFVFSAAIILFVTAAAKFFAAAGSAEALSSSDPLVPLSNRMMLGLAGGIELVLSGFLLVNPRQQKTGLLLVAWLSTNYLVYRIGLWWFGAPVYSDCLGSLNEKLFISPWTVHYIMLAALAWLLAGSYLFLILDWSVRRRASVSTSIQSRLVKA